MKKSLIVAAEPSAENYAISIVKEFKKKSNIHFFGVGGDRLSRAGVDIIIHNKEFSLIGIVEVLFSIVKMKKYLNKLVSFAKKNKADFVLLIDFPDFNLRLAKALNKKGIKVFYFISPTVWAWRYKRVNLIKKYIDHIFIIFPFEKEIFEKEGISHTYTGHPLKTKVKSTLASQNQIKKELSIKETNKIITLLPGSRKSEIKNHLKVLLKTSELIHNECKEVQFFLLKADHISQKSLELFLDDNPLSVRIIDQKYAYDLISVSQAVISSCGTSNLEICLLKIPFCAVYKVNNLSYFLGKGFLKINLYSIVNILAKKEVIKEFIQFNLKPGLIFKEIKRILNDEKYRDDMIGEFKKIGDLLKEDNNPSKIIVNKILSLL